MSEHDRRDPDEILERNVERLLEHAGRRPEVPADARARMLAKLREPGPAAIPIAANDAAARRRRFTWVGVAVALAAAVILAWVLGLGRRLVDDPTQPELAYFEHDGLAARSITLGDGSTALLRPGTRLRELGPRHLELVAGEILVDVAAAVEPMLIETSQGQAAIAAARVLLRSDDAATLAAVMTGAATLAGKSELGTELLIRAGEQALIEAASVPERIAGRRLSFELDWARELLAPTTTPAPIRRGNLLARVPRWTGQLGQSPEWPLPIRELTVDVHVEHGHLRATIDQTFFNHLDRDLEGVYKFPLPPKAAISRLAMYVDGQRMEAGVVERDRGRDIYEQIVHRRRDPALLEWLQGNLFQVRIFPLPARTEKRILLSYTAALDELYGEGELRVPIPEIDLPVDQVNYRIRVVGAAGREFASRSHEFALRRDGDDLIAEFSAQNHAIGADIVATLAGDAAPVEHHRLIDGQGRRHHGVRLRPELRRELEPLGADASAQPARDWIVLFDSSASRGAAELDAQRRFVAELLATLDGGDRLALALFDSRVRWADAELRPVAQLDAAALAEFMAREARVGLGLTDLGLALDEAVARLAAAPAVADDGRERIPTILYLGDGLSEELDGGLDQTGRVDQLAARYAGRAQLVALSFGQAYDAPALEQLAAAGAGLHVHVEEGESLSWRAVELLATLATARVLELEGRLLDAQGQAIATQTTHASARSLADGEALELLARLDADAPEPVAVELRGRAEFGFAGGDAREWTKRFELPQADDDARWLPRAWARAHVAALTEAGVDDHADEITELGLAHFLVTPTTSLLVLESEAMYRDFAVHRPPADAWARYDAPDRIEVIREHGKATAGRGQYVARAPVAMLASYASWPGQVQTRGFGPLTGEPIGIGTLGIIGTGRGGGGSGGFGLGLGPSGLIGKGGGSGSGSGYGAGSGGGFAARGKRVDQRRTADRSRRGGDFSGIIGRVNASPSWSSEAQQARFASAHASNLASLDLPFASTIVTGATLDAASLDGLWPSTLPWPQALHYANDPRLDDLGELVPALFESPFDLAREQLLIRGLDGARGSISEPAAALIGRARAAQADVRFALPEGGALDIDARGRFALTHERWGFLAERIVYDGEQLHADYPQLGLSVVRAVGPTSPALLDEWVPWLVPEADHLARFYDVEQTGPRTLKLTIVAEPDADSAASERPWLEVELDERDRVIALHVRRGEQTVSTQRFRWTDAGLELDGGRTLTRVGPAQAIATTPQATRVDLPLPSPADLALELDELAPGSPEWIAVQQQRLAGSAALGQLQDCAAILAALANAAGRVLPGELVLAGAGLRYAAEPERAAVLAAAATDPISALVRANLEPNERKRAAALQKLAAASELDGTPVGFLASYRALLGEAERSPGEASLRRLERFLAGYEHPSFALVATLQLSNRWWSRPERKAAAWLALAQQDNLWKYHALHQAGLAHYYRGRTQDAAKLYERAFAEAEADGAVPVVDWTVQHTMTQRIGEAGWQLAWTRLRERVAAAGDARLALRFLAMAEQLGRPEDGQRVLDRLDPDTLDPSLGVAVFDALIAGGHVSEAKAVLASLRERAPDSTEVLLRASTLAEQQGELDEAAQALEQALALILDGQGLTLDELRRGFERLFTLRARQARPLTSDADEVEAALRAALAVADRWRHEDPDNPLIDQRCAELLWSLGRDDEAWRQISSVLDRHAAEGEALAWLADALERAGRFDRAAQAWDLAIAVEPTDAHNRLRRASNLLATGREAEAEAALRELVDGDWQPRFSWDLSQARELLARLESD